MITRKKLYTTFLKIPVSSTWRVPGVHTTPIPAFTGPPLRTGKEWGCPAGLPLPLWSFVCQNILFCQEITSSYFPADQSPFKSQGAHIWGGRGKGKLGSTLSGVSSAKKLRCQVREPRKTRRHWPPSGPPKNLFIPLVFHMENLRFILNDNTKNNLTPLFF